MGGCVYDTMTKLELHEAGMDGWVYLCMHCADWGLLTWHSIENLFPMQQSIPGILLRLISHERHLRIGFEKQSLQAWI